MAHSNITMTTAGRQQSRIKKQHYRVERIKVTQDKKTLRSILSFRTEPPPGYTFIPAGNPELTQALKDVAREGNHEIFAVSTTPHAKVHDLSKEVHRIGFHFPSIVVAQVCAYYGITLTREGTILDAQGAQSIQQLRKGRKANKNGETTEDQVALNTKARDSIKDLFPNIPDDDLYKIIKTAFQKGDKRVGTAAELSLIRRAQLAVVAHIRHVYTQYDRLLRTVGYHDARGKVEGPTLKKLVEWRGDDENGSKAIEEVMKDVVVISDEEESDDELEEAERLEPQQLQVQRYNANLPRVEKFTELEHNLPSEDDAGYSYVPQARRRRKMANDQFMDESQYRRAAWERARQEYRAHPTSLQPIVVLENPDDRQHREQLTFNMNTPSSRLRHDMPSPQLSSQTRLREIEASKPPQNHNYIRGEDGALYRRVPPRIANPDHEIIYARRPVEQLPERIEYSREQFVNRPRNNSDRFPEARMSSPNIYDDGESIVQSIEGPQISPNGFRRSFPGQFPTSHNGARMLVASGEHASFIDLTNSSPQVQKKRKLNEIFDNVRPVDRFDREFQGQPLQRMEVIDTQHYPQTRVRSERVLAELPHSRLVRSQHQDIGNHPQSRPTNPASQRDFPSTPMSTFRAVDVSSAPSRLPVNSDSASLRAQQYTHSVRPLSPRNSFIPLHSTDGQSVRYSYIKEREPINLISEKGGSVDHRQVVNVRPYPTERRLDRAEVYSRQIRDDQAIRPQTRQLIELVPISRTLSQDDTLVRRRGYLPASDSSNGLLMRQPIDDSDPGRRVRPQTEFVMNPQDRRYDRPLQQTYVQN